MEILKTSKMLNGTKIQLEKNFNNFWIGAYPVSKQTGSKQFSPIKGKTFRLSLHFNNLSEAKKIFKKLEEGKTSLLKCKKYVWEKSYLNYLK